MPFSKDYFLFIVIIGTTFARDFPLLPQPDRARLREFLLERRAQSGVGLEKPRPLSTEPVLVNVTFKALEFIGLSELEETMTLAPDLKLTWIDEYWRYDFNPNMSSIPYISVESSLTWKPRLMHWNNLNDIYVFSKSDDFGLKLMYIYPDGVVKWFTGSSLITAKCSLDFTAFPFDRQSCSVYIGFVDPCDEVQLVSTKFDIGSQVLPKFISDNSIWDIVGSETIRPPACSPFSVAAEFRIYFKRRPTQFIYSTILPQVFLTLMQLTTFVIPVDGVAADRASYSVTVQLSFGVLQTTINTQIPPSATLNYISILIAIQMAISTLITVYAASSCFIYQRYVNEAVDSPSFNRDGLNVTRQRSYEMDQVVTTSSSAIYLRRKRFLRYLDAAAFVASFLIVLLSFSIITAMMLNY